MHLFSHKTQEDDQKTRDVKHLYSRVRKTLLESIEAKVKKASKWLQTPRGFHRVATAAAVTTPAAAPRPVATQLSS